jgi:hypothetical protein
VHVTVNNFITPDKKAEIQGKNTVNTRPYSSDQKDREKDKKPMHPKKILTFDTNALLSFKSPYDTRLGGTRNGSQFKPRKEKEERELRNNPPAFPFERPQSAKNRSTGFSNRMKEDLMVTNGITNTFNLSKRRFPSNPKE